MQQHTQVFLYICTKPRVTDSDFIRTTDKFTFLLRTRKHQNKYQASMCSNMSVNSSFASPPLSSSNSSLLTLLEKCSSSRIGVVIVTAFSLTNIVLVLVLAIVVLYLGFRRWRQQRSLRTTSHSDLLTYNVVVVVLAEVFGSGLYCVSVYTNISNMISFWYDFFCINWNMKMQFHTLTCVERYLAVVHPVTYFGLKNKGGVRIRQICIGCVWVGLMPVTTAEFNLIMFFCYLVSAFTVICFCSVSVLRALRRPGPGEPGGDRDRVDQLKSRAFHTIVAIMCVLLLSLAGVLLCNALYVSVLLSSSDSCVMMMALAWLSLPSSLVSTLLYLHGVGKLPSCSREQESG